MHYEKAQDISEEIYKTHRQIVEGHIVLLEDARLYEDQPLGNWEFV